MGVHVTPAGKLKGNVSALHKRLRPRVERGLRKMAEFILEEAQDLVPKDTMALHDSGHVLRDGSGFNAVFVVGFGSRDFDSSAYGEDRIRRPPSEYAVYVHQMQIEFLLIPVLTKQQEMIEVFNHEMFGAQTIEL